MNWQSFVIIGIIVILFIILMIINASTADLDQEDEGEECCLTESTPDVDTTEAGELPSQKKTSTRKTQK